jgi:hypothetical protein
MRHRVFIALAFSRTLRLPHRFRPSRSGISCAYLPFAAAGFGAGSTESASASV